MIHTVRIFLVLLLCYGSAAGATNQALTPQEILRQSDEARGNLAGVTWTVDMVAIESGSTNTRRVLVKARGFDVFAVTEAPPRRKGDTLIMVKGNMWFYQPNVSKPVPISRRQKLLGKAANGDIAATNYAEDYAVESLSEGKHDDEPCYVFDLKALTSVSTYSKIRYWVSKERLVGTKAEYYTATGGKLIKSAFMAFDNRVTTDRGERPFISRMLITDELTSKDTTTLSFSEPRFTSISDDIFNLNLLTR